MGRLWRGFPGMSDRTMYGIHAAFEGRIGRKAELRATKKGKPWLSFSLPIAFQKNNYIITACN
jgi:hypothetical protein